MAENYTVKVSAQFDATEATAAYKQWKASMEADRIRPEVDAPGAGGRVSTFSGQQVSVAGGGNGAWPLDRATRYAEQKESQFENRQAAEAARLAAYRQNLGLQRATADWGPGASYEQGMQDLGMAAGAGGGDANPMLKRIGTLGAAYLAYRGVEQIAQYGAEAARQRIVFGATSSLDEQIQMSESLAAGEYGNPIRYWTQKFISGPTTGWMVSDPDDDLRGIREARINRRFQSDADKMRLESRSTGREADIAGLRGAGKAYAAAEASYQDFRDQWVQKLREYYTQSTPDSWAATLAVYDLSMQHKNLRNAEQGVATVAAQDIAEGFEDRAGAGALAAKGMSYSSSLALMRKRNQRELERLDRETSNLPNHDRVMSSARLAGDTDIDVLNYETERDNALSARAINLSSRADELSQSGNYPGANRARVTAKFSEMAGKDLYPIYSDNGEIIAFKAVDEKTPGIASKIDAMTGAVSSAYRMADVDTARRSALEIGKSAALDALLAHDPLGASRASIQAQRDALELLDHNSQAYTEGMAALSRQDSLASQLWAEKTSDIDSALRGQRSALQSGLRREAPEAGEAFGIGSEGRQQALDLIRGGRVIEGMNSYENTLTGLDLLKQQYMDQFRGVQVDPRLTATQGSRQSQDPQAVIDAINRAKQELIEGIKQALQEVAAA